jgi:hypothetical protein
VPPEAARICKEAGGLILFGTDSTETVAIAREALCQQGKGNLGIFLHTLRHPGGKTSLSVEKRVPNGNKQEIAVCLQLYSRTQAQAWQPGNPLPMVQNVVLCPNYTAVFMPHYAGLGRRPRKATLYGQRLAKALLNLASCDLALAPTNATIQELNKSFGFVLSQRRCLRHPGYMAIHTKTIGLCLKSLPLLRQLPVVISHNDLHSKNICLSDQGECARIIFLDLGMIALNYAGADLRHVLRKSTRKRYWKRVYTAALQSYSEGMHCDPRLISLAAHCYALLRWLKSCRAAIEKVQSSQQINAKLLQATQLHQSGSTLLQELRRG